MTIRQLATRLYPTVEGIILGFLSRPDKLNGSSLVNYGINDLFHCSDLLRDGLWEEGWERVWYPGQPFESDKQRRRIEYLVVAAFTSCLQTMVDNGLIELNDWDKKALRAVPTDALRSTLRLHGGNGLEVPRTPPHPQKDMPRGFAYEAKQPRFYRAVPSCYQCVIDHWGQSLVGKGDAWKITAEYANRQVAIWREITLKEYNGPFYTGKTTVEDRGRQSDKHGTTSDFGAAWARTISCTEKAHRLTATGRQYVGWALMVHLDLYYGWDGTVTQFCQTGWEIRSALIEAAKHHGGILKVVNAFVGFDPTAPDPEAAKLALAVWALCTEPENRWRLMIELDTKTSAISNFAYLVGDPTLLEIAGFNPATQFKRDAYRPYGLNAGYRRLPVKNTVVPRIYGSEKVAAGITPQELSMIHKALKDIFKPIMDFRDATLHLAEAHWSVGDQFNFVVVQGRIPDFHKAWCGETQEVSIIINGHNHSVPVTFKYEVDRKIMRRWFPCTFLHGFDACSMGRLCYLAMEEQIEIRAIHDAVLVHPNNGNWIRTSFSRAMREMRFPHLKTWLENWVGPLADNQVIPLYKKWFGISIVQQIPDHFNPEVILR